MSHLETLSPLIGIIAAERTKDSPDLFEDARQEGLIRAWKVAEENPDAPREYVLAAARKAIADVVRGRPAFGAESHRGKADAADTATALVMSEDDDEDAVAALADPTAEVALHLAEISSVRAEVREAVSRLPLDDATLIHLRFAEEESWPEVAHRLGKRTEATRRRFVDHLAPALAEELAHLRGVAA